MMSTFKQMALLLGISDRQLRRYAEEGKIVGVYTTKGGHWRLRGKLTEARVARARTVLRLNPLIAEVRKREHLKRANEVIKDVHKQWRKTFNPPKKKASKSQGKKATGALPKPGEAVQGDLFGGF